MLPERVASMPVNDIAPRGDIDLVFSALAASVAGDVEVAWAKSGVPVFSNARNHRMAHDVPLLVPEVNAEHLKLVGKQKSGRGYPESGFIITNPNCSTTFLAMALAPLERTFGLKRVSVVTLQAISGAGYPGLPSMDILGNVIPFISGEETKIEEETKKILGEWVDGIVEPASFPVSAQVNRIPVLDGHTEAVSFELRGEVPIEEIREALTSFRGEPQRQNLPRWIGPSTTTVGSLSGKGHGDTHWPPPYLSCVGIQDDRSGPQHDPRRCRGFGAQCGTGPGAWAHWRS
jgi:aspartate-semialdehyde dehydrogenase